MKRAFVCIASGALAIASASRAGAATIGATVVNASTGNYSLTSVSVTRGSAGTFTYVPSQLTGVTLTDVDAFDIPLLVSRGASLPAAGTRHELIEDFRLDTGVINITTTNGTNGTSGTPNRSVELTFAQPVVNSAGEDILLFETGGDDGLQWWVNNDPVNRAATLATSSYSADLLTGVPFTRFRYANGGDVDIGGADGDDGVAELESPSGFAFVDDSSSTINALGLDLSLVGVPLGGSVTSIRFQTLAGGSGRIDPVLVVGLPVVPEPTAALALATISAIAIRRRR